MDVEQFQPADEGVVQSPFQQEAPNGDQWADEQQPPELSLEEQRAQWAEREAQLSRELEEERRAKAERDQQLAQYNADLVRQRQEAWTQSEHQAKAHAKTLPFDEATEYLAGFYQRREQELFNWGTSLVQQQEQERLRLQAQAAVKQYGLPDEDEETLFRAAAYAGDARVIDQEAKRLKQRDEKAGKGFRELQERTERLERSMSREQLARSGAQRGGAGTGRHAPANYKPGTSEHLRSLLADFPEFQQ